MNVLYYLEPKLEYPYGGVSNVAYNLPRALANRVGIMYHPRYIPRRSYVVSLFNVYSSLVMRNFNIVHFNVTPSWSNGSYALIKFAKMSGASTLLNIHGFVQVDYILDYLASSGSRPALPPGLSRTPRFCKIVDKIVTYSEFMRSYIIDWYRVPRDNIAVIPNGVNLRKFGECNSELLLEGDPAILFVGLLSNFKSADLLIRATAKLRSQLPNIKSHLVGHGDNTDLKRLAKKEDVEKHVVFHGYVSSAIVPQYYKSADLCIFPSRWDSAGLTLLEAMASGTPVIASNRGGTPEIITHGENGILFEPEDVNALPKAIMALHQNSSLKKKISKNELKTVAKYSWENIAEKYVSLYEDLCQ